MARSHTIALLRNLVSEDDCIKASLTEMKLEPADNDLDIPQVSGARKADKVNSANLYPNKNMYILLSSLSSLYSPLTASPRVE